jgi:hypothetical protein
MVNYLAIIAIKCYKYLIIIALYNEIGYIYYNMLTSELPNEPPRSKLRGISRLVAALQTKQASGNMTRRD